MKKLLTVIALLFTSAAFAETIQFTNGRWFDGSKFVDGSFYSVDGTLTRKSPASVDHRVDLQGKYVVPAFGDAHHHGIDGAQGLDEKIRAFLDAGVFYVKNPNVIPDLLTPEVRAKLNRDDSIDVTFSNGGLTAPNGHPVGLHAMLAKRGVFPGLTPDQMNDRAYFTIGSIAELDEKWPRILAGKPDFIKTFVLFTGLPKQQGLTPEVLRAVVAKAHAAGLRVSSHIETAEDFRVAVDAGVDEINHMPQPRKEISPDFSAYVIDEALAKLAAKKKIVVVTTVSAASMRPGDRTAERAIEIRNLQTLLKNDVIVALGSDGISGEPKLRTTKDEGLYMKQYDYATNLALLKMMSENAPRTIFPKRKLGRFDEGYEASFLVLEGNPLEDFANVAKIAMRVKHGKAL